MTELKPCPFCGKPMTFVYNSFDDAFKFSHKYGEDEESCCVIGEIWLKGKSLTDARKNWNRRAGLPQGELQVLHTNCFGNCGVTLKERDNNDR